MGSRLGLGFAGGIAGFIIVACATFDEAPADPGGDAGSDALSASDGLGPDGSTVATDPNGCPIGHGPAMVRVDGKFCIDSTEVTHAQYKEFLDAMGGSTGTQIPECSANTSFRPDDDPQWTLAPGRDGYPITQVDWCDAHAFCAWSGKRLCGRIGTGGAVATEPAIVADPKVDEWFYACSEGGKRTFPYGSSYDLAACNGELGDGGDGRISEVKSFPGCQGGFPGIFDMSGNVMEWENACTSSEPSAACFVRSNGFFEGEDVADCSSFRSQPRTGFLFHIGIRCCAN